MAKSIRTLDKITILFNSDIIFLSQVMHTVIIIDNMISTVNVLLYACSLILGGMSLAG